MEQCQFLTLANSSFTDQLSFGQDQKIEEQKDAAVIRGNGQWRILEERRQLYTDIL